MTLVLALVAGGLAVAVVVLSLRWREARHAAEAAEGRTVRAERVVAERDRVTDRLRSSLEALPIGVVVVDEDGAVLLRNRHADQVLGVHHLDVLVREAVERHLASARRGECRSSTFEVYGPPRRTLRITGTPVPVADQPAVSLVTIEDVTERARLDAARTDMVAALSHELKTPVGAMALLAETLAGEDDSEVVDRLAEKLVGEAHRLNQIIEELLELARVELGGLGEPKVVTAVEVIDAAVERTRAMAEAKGTEVKVMVGAGTDLVGNRRQLASALGNLVENAVKYSDAGALVEVEAAAAGGWVNFTVRDHGIGIPGKDLERIFERFFRVDKARSRETGGTGLGLSIVRHVATNHGGHIAVVSHEGEGSTFTLRLPRPGAGLTELAEAS